MAWSQEREGLACLTAGREEGQEKVNAGDLPTELGEPREGSSVLGC